MFLVIDKRFGATNLVFTWQDPRKDGFAGPVEEGVTIDYDMEAVHRWPDGAERPEACVGRAPDNPKHYKVFKYARDLKAAGHTPAAGKARVFGSWSDYLRMFPRVDQPLEDWFESLDEIDKIARRRREAQASDPAPSGSNREELARWVARHHMLADSGIREVWYLPKGSAPDEIRLLEVSERIDRNGNRAEPIDFGLEVNGRQLKLLVADVNGQQVERMKTDPSLLPAGWEITGSQVWGRKG